jgi:hypothetical protein
VAIVVGRGMRGIHGISRFVATVVGRGMRGIHGFGRFVAIVVGRGMRAPTGYPFVILFCNQPIIVSNNKPTAPIHTNAKITSLM